MGWVEAILLSAISSVVSFIVFLLLEVFWGDTLKDTLDASYQSGAYVNINLIIWIGLMFVFGTSFIVNLILYRDFTIKSKLYANLFSIIITGIILFFVSWILIIVNFSEGYTKLTLTEEIRLVPYHFALVSIYILPNPVWFWLIALILYHVILIFFIRFYFKPKPFNLQKNKKPKKKNTVNKNKYKMW